jgi:hypothetical protein
MLLKLALAISALWDLEYQQKVHAPELVIASHTHRVNELLWMVPSDLHTAIREYMKQRREWTSLKIEDILFQDKKVTTTVEPVKLAANDTRFTEIQTAQV